MSQTISHHHALLYVMVTMSAVDRTMDEVETNRIGQIVQTLPVFKDFSPDNLIHAASNCGAILQDDEGLETVLSLVAQALPQKLHETAYALAVDVAAANLSVEQEELRFLQMLRDRLRLDKLTVAAIERGARARHQVL